MAWNSYAETYDLPVERLFDNSINKRDREWKGIHFRVSSKIIVVM
jgi:hypothetical protein